MFTRNFNILPHRFCFFDNWPDSYRFNALEFVRLAAYLTKFFQKAELVLLNNCRWIMFEQAEANALLPIFFGYDADIRENCHNNALFCLFRLNNRIGLLCYVYSAILFRSRLLMVDYMNKIVESKTSVIIHYMIPAWAKSCFI